jgi:hypothetical protein
MRLDTSKLFRALVLGGISLAVPACSSGTPAGDKDASSSGTTGGAGSGGTAGKGSGGHAGSGSSGTSGTASDASDKCPPPLPAGCAHGMCSW